MNLALPAVVLFIIFSPGFLYSIITRFDYKNGQLIFQEYPGRSILEKVFISTIPAILIHILSLSIVEFFGYTIDSESLGNILVASNLPKEVSTAYTKLINDRWFILIYGMVSFLIAFLLGAGNRILIILLKLDVRYDFFRFRNPMYYKFIGLGEKDFDFVFVDALVNAGGKNIIYSGILTEWEYKNDGELDTIHLTNAFKRFVIDTETEFKNSGIKEIVTEIPGSELVLKCENIINFNFQYTTHDAIEGWRNKVLQIPGPLVTFDA